MVEFNTIGIVKFDFLVKVDCTARNGRLSCQKYITFVADGRQGSGRQGY